MNWGYGILGVIIVFLVSMMGMVYVASQQTNDMMDKDYYARELRHQQIIDATHNLQAVATDQLILQSQAGQLRIALPPATYQQLSKGTIELLKPNDRQKDLVLPLLPDANGIQNINDRRLVQGFYRARLSWENEGKAYYHEQDINIALWTNFGY